MRKPSDVQTVGDILKKFNPLEDKYISREFQAYGYYLSEKLNDPKHKSIYMRLAKTMPRAILDKALSFVLDARVDHKGALFMWKLKQMGAWEHKVSDKGRSSSGRKSEKKKIEEIPF